MSDGVLDQSEIERLLGGGGGASAAVSPPAPAPPATDTNDGILSQDELNALFGGASAAPSKSDTKAAAAPPMPDAGGIVGQDELDALFGQPIPAAAPIPPPVTAEAPSFAGPPIPPMAAAPAFTAPPVAPPGGGGGIVGGTGDFGGLDDDDEGGVPRGDIDYIMKRADDTIRSIASNPLSIPSEVIEFQFPEFGGTVPSSEHATLDQISEVDLDVKIELGRTYMYLEDVLKLRRGSVVPLDKIAGDTVDIFVNGRLLARGEVLVMNENFCVRVAELLAGAIPME
jgi:flagellar motor switch protein FliN/FliY